MKTLNSRISSLESRQHETRLVVWYKDEGESLEQCLKRNGIPEDYPRDRLVVLEVVYEPPVADARPCES
ncbi:MAG TPA: hypothetical protein EYP67_00470 [Methanosarcinales archaeon]|nr:hypothetical protein [Methanosarcinales archaeon]